MRRTLFAVLMAAFAAGCSPSSTEPVSSTDGDSQISITDDAGTDGGQTPDATADANATLVTLKVPSMW